MHIASRLRKGAVIALALAVAAVGLGAQPAAAAIEGNKTITGYAHDIKLYNGLGIAESGPVSAAGVGCSDQAPLFYSVGLADVALGGVSLGVSSTQSQATKSGTVQTVTSTFQTTGVNLPLLLGLALKADAITVTSTVTYDTATQQFTNSSSMNVTNLTVRNGLLPPVISLNGIVAPDATPINIPGVATIGFHATELYGSNGAGLMGKMATGIKVDILGSTVDIALGETYAALYGSTDQNWLFGAAEGLQTRTSDELLTVGPVVTAQVPCAGGGPVESSIAGVTLPADLGSVGAVTSDAIGTRDGLDGAATTTSEVAGVNLAGGLVTADAIGSVSHAETSDGGQTVAFDGSTSVLTNLVVAGVPVAIDTAPNTYIGLPAGLGYVIVNARTEYASGIEMIPLVVHLNSVGPTPAIDIVVARSFAFVLGPNTSGAAATQAMEMLNDTDVMQSSILSEITDGDVAELGIEPEGIKKGWEKNAEKVDGNNGKAKGKEKKQ